MDMEHHDRYRSNDWDTSVEAGEAADAKGVCRAAVFIAHQDNPFGMTDGEMGEYVDALRVARGQSPFPQDSMRKRRTDLFHEGVLTDTGERRMSPDTHRSMIVWRLVPEGERTPNPRRRRARSARVQQAVDNLERWMEFSEGQMIVSPPDFDDIRTLIDGA